MKAPSESRADKSGDYSAAVLPETDASFDPDDDDADVASVTALCLHVPAALGGERLDRVVASLLPDHSRSRIQGWIRDGRVNLDGRECRDVRAKPAPGATLAVLPAVDPARLPDAPEAIPLNIVYQDDAILVLDKPPGLVVHPGSGNRTGTLLNGLLHHDPALAAVPRAGIVHRLDKDTSGLMVVARTAIAQTDLVRQLQARTVRREYLALAIGRVAAAVVVDAPIGRHPTQRTKMAVVRQGGKPARTHVTILERFAEPSLTLVSCALDTGRTHQIRVHLASLGHPLVGDSVYGGRALAQAPAFPRQALHAARLGLIHPLSGASLSWDSPLPDDFAGLLRGLRSAA